MKVLLRWGILSILMAMVAASCSAPCDVPANRREIVDSTGMRGDSTDVRDSLVGKLTVSTSVIDFDDKTKQELMLLSLENNSHGTYVIRSVRLVSGARFGFQGPAQDTLAPGTATFIKVFTRDIVGESTDTLIIDDSIRVLLRTNVGTDSGLVWVSDVDFGIVKIGTASDSQISIVNDSKVSVVVNSITLNGPGAPAFSFLNQMALPMEIEGGQRLDLGIRFTPFDTLEYRTTVQCAIIPSRLVSVDDNGVASGRGRR